MEGRECDKVATDKVDQQNPRIHEKERWERGVNVAYKGSVGTVRYGKSSTVGVLGGSRVSEV